MDQPNPSPSAAGAPLPNATPPDSAPKRERTRALRLLMWLLLVLVALAAFAVSAAWWALRSERGSAWLLSTVPGLQVERPKGALLADFEAASVSVALPNSKNRITLTDLSWRGWTLARGSGRLWAHVALDTLHVRRIDVAWLPSTDAKAAPKPLQPPSDLRLPIELELRSFTVGELHATPLGDVPILDIDTALHLSADAGTTHRMDHLSLRWDRLTLAADAHIASAAPMLLAAHVKLAQDAAQNLPAWGATATLNGPLAEPVLSATLRASPDANLAAPTARAPQPTQSLDATATLHPFAAWPLGALSAEAEGLDLSAFSSAAPTTALSLHAHADASAMGQPLNTAVDLTNALAGRWDEARLPLQSLSLELGLRPDQPGDLDLHALTAELGTPKAPAGRISASGRYSAAPGNTRWNIDAAIVGLKPAGLDARAPAMELGGPVTAMGRPAPDGSTGVDLKADLKGRLVDPKIVARETAGLVELRVDASIEPRQIALRELKATAGAAHVTASGTAAQDAPGGAWHTKAQARIADLDPAAWWPGDAASPWRGTRNRLNATLAVDTTLLLPANGQPALQALAALRGSVNAALEPSLLAGVPLSGKALLRGSAGAPLQASANLDADGNALRLDGRLATGPVDAKHPASDAWDVTIDAKALDRLAPVFKLLQPTGADATLAGSLTAQAQVTGRWPDMTTRGGLDAAGLRIATLGVKQAHAQWSAGTSPTDAVELQATLSQITTSGGATPGPSLESAALQLTGSARAHTLTLRADSKARPPAWVESSLSRVAATSVVPASGAAPAAVPATTQTTAAASSKQPLTVALLRLQGGLVDQPSAALSGWRGTLQQLQLRSSDERVAPLLQTRDLALEAFWAGGPSRASVQAGRIGLLGGALRWDRLAWQAADDANGTPMRIDADARLEPFLVAPLLSAAQPDLGWRGDLSIAGHLKVRSAPSFSADIVVERNAGDLSVTDELGSHALGLTDLRLGLNAADGTWNFTTGIAGRTLGVTSGAVVVRTSPQAVWPTPDAALQGVFEVQVADLSTLSAWVPAGWRVGGGLHANASFGGRFGAPEYTGTIEGTQLSVRNFLEGVKVTDGDVAVRLQGTHATIERFSAKGGDGSLRLDGTAEFGEAPQAQLKLTADKFVLLGRVDRRIVASGSGSLLIDSKKLAFDGSFGVDEGLIDFSRSDAPGLSEDVLVSRAAGVLSPAAAASAAASPKAAVPTPAAILPTVAAPAPAPARTLALGLRINLGDKLALRGHGLAARLAGDLKITSPEGKLAVDGSVNVVDGTYEAYGQNLVIDRGIVAFNGPIDRPRLDIEATRPKLDIRVGVTITGTADNPRVRLFSEPDLSEVDKLSWLVLGHASDDVGRAENALLQRAALALVSGEGPGVTDKVTKALGLDELSLGQSDGEVKQTVLSLGKKLSERWSIGYEHGLNAATGSFQLIYKIAKRFTLRAQSGDDNAVDVIWTWRWQ